MSQRYAAIDIGTVTCRLLVADVDASELHELARECAITNLGEGVDGSGVLKQEAMLRVKEQIQRFIGIIESYKMPDHPTINTIAIATSASRDAKNSDEFVQLLEDLGVSLTIISGEREASLSFLGASSDFLGENLLVVDIGGGSTELICGRVDREGNEPQIELKHSFDVGCRRITEKMLQSDPPSGDELLRASQATRKSFTSYFEYLDARGISVDRIVAVAGTATTVVSVYDRMKIYDTTRVHKRVVEGKIFNQVYGLLRSRPLEERKQIVGLQPERASIIVAGMVIMEVVLELSGKDSFTVSESDILQGIILNAVTK